MNLLSGGEWKQNKDMSGLPGVSVVTASPSSAGAVDSAPGQGAGIPHASWMRHRNMNTNNIVTNSTKTLKMVHIKNFFLNFNDI